MDARVATLEAHDRTIATRLAALEARMRALELQAERAERAERARSAAAAAAWGGRVERPPGVDESGCWSGTNNSYGEY